MITTRLGQIAMRLLYQWADSVPSVLRPGWFTGSGDATPVR
jgi:hypothetical protein